MDKETRLQGLRYDEKRLKNATDPTVIGVLTYHIVLTKERLKEMK